MRIRAICIDDANRPKEIPQNKWLVKDKEYHITWVFKMVNQNGIQGVSIAEHDISDCLPYNCYRLTRFAIHLDDILNLIELIEACTGMDQIKIKELIKEVELIEQ